MSDRLKFPPGGMRAGMVRDLERERARSDPGLPPDVAARLALRRAEAKRRRRTPLEVARAEARRQLDRFANLGVEALVCGSAGRELELVGDLDLAVIARTVEERAMLAEHAALFREGSACPVDIRLGLRESRGVLLTILRGPAEFSEALKVIAARRGFRLVTNCLMRDGQVVEVQTEERLFEILGLPWVPYEERGLGASWTEALGRISVPMVP